MKTKKAAGRGGYQRMAGKRKLSQINQSVMAEKSEENTIAEQPDIVYGEPICEISGRMKPRRSHSLSISINSEEIR